MTAASWSGIADPGGSEPPTGLACPKSLSRELIPSSPPGFASLRRPKAVMPRGASASRFASTKGADDLSLRCGPGDVRAGQQLLPDAAPGLLSAQLEPLDPGQPRNEVRI